MSIPTARAKPFTEVTLPSGSSGGNYAEVQVLLHIIIIIGCAVQLKATPHKSDGAFAQSDLCGVALIKDTERG